MEGVVESPVFDLAWLNTVLAFFLPLVISFIKRAAWSVAAKKRTAFIVSAVLGVVNVGVTEGWIFGTLWQFLALAVYSIMNVFVVASVIYDKFWDGKVVDTRLTSITIGGNGKG